MRSVPIVGIILNISSKTKTKVKKSKKVTCNPSDGAFLFSIQNCEQIALMGELYNFFLNDWKYTWTQNWPNTVSSIWYVVDNVQVEMLVQN